MLNNTSKLVQESLNFNIFSKKRNEVDNLKRHYGGQNFCLGTIRFILTLHTVCSYAFVETDIINVSKTILLLHFFFHTRLFYISRSEDRKRIFFSFGKKKKHLQKGKIDYITYLCM